MSKISTFIRKFDSNHVDGDPLYGHSLGWLLIMSMWGTIGVLFYIMSHKYWTIEYFNFVLQDTLTHLRNSYMP